MPKRKFHLWYSKDDYLKEREEEQKKKQTEQQQNDDITQTPITNENAQPTNTENGTKLSENEAIITPATIISQQLTAESPQTPPIGNEEKTVAETETTPIPLGDQTQAPDKSNTDNKPETQPVTETPTLIIAAPPPTEPETQPTPTEPETKPTQMETENLEPAQTENKPAEPQTIDMAPAQMEEATTPNEIQTKQTEPEITTEMVIAQAQDLAQQLVVPVEDESKPDQTEVVAAQIEQENKVPLTAGVESIEKYTDILKSLLPTRAVVSIGEYPVNILLKDTLITKKETRVLPLFVEKSSGDVVKWGQGKLESGSIVCLDEDVDTHFWYDILPIIAKNERFYERIKNQHVEKLQGTIMIASIWKGLGSALLPTLISEFKELKVNSVALALLPSKAQPLDCQINALASVGICTYRGDTPILLLERDNLESYSGVDRDGYGINGNLVLNYLVDLMLSKETFVEELVETSKSFDTKMFVPMLASGMSLKIYGSIENMLNTILVRPLLNFDLSTASLLYVVTRMPFHLRDKLPRGQIELAIDNWFSGKANLESIQITEPIYTDDSSDRVDIALFIGGFNTQTRFTALEKRVTKMKNQAIKKGAITEEDWAYITKNLIE